MPHNHRNWTNIIVFLNMPGSSFLKEISLNKSSTKILLTDYDTQDKAWIECFKNIYNLKFNFNFAKKFNCKF